MFTVFSKKKYLENGGEYPSFADECNGHVIDGDNGVRGTDYVLSAENVKRWCVWYDPKCGDRVVLNCAEWKEGEIVECNGVKSYEAGEIRVERTTPSPLGFNSCTVSNHLVERVVDFEKEETAPASEKKINVSSFGNEARADVGGTAIFVKRYPNEQEEDMVCRLVKMALEELDG